VEAPPPASSIAPELADWQMQVLNQINEQRAARGLPLLAWNAELAAAAQAHAEDLAHRNKGGHVGSDGARLATRLVRAGYNPRASTENWANARSPQHCFAMWFNEPPGQDPHRRAILGKTYTEVGIGVAKGAWGYYFIADFGAR
jgi:uncharacterized protein YkwD